MCFGNFERTYKFEMCSVNCNTLSMHTYSSFKNLTIFCEFLSKNKTFDKYIKHRDQISFKEVWSICIS